ncbi:hypothetical protein Tco_0448969 [Tanacetum coccineum]
MNRKRNEEVENGFVEEIRAGKEDLIEEIGESDKKWYNGMFRSADKVNSTETEPNVSMNKIDCEKECLSDNHAISSDKMCTDENENVSTNNSKVKDNNTNKQASYAQATMDNNVISNKLSFVPTETLDDFLLIEVLAKLATKSVLGEMRRFEADNDYLLDILPYSNGVFLFKFHHNEELQFVLENGPWLLLNVPLEAWTEKGLSVIASTLVLAEDSWIRLSLNANAEIKGSKFVKVEYITSAETSNNRKHTNCDDSKAEEGEYTKYFKDNWERSMLEKGNENGSSDMEDVLVNENDVARCIAANEVEGLSHNVLSDN